MCRCITTGHPSVRQIQGLHCCETPFMSDGKLLNCDSLYRLVAHPSNHWTRSRATDIDNRGMRFAASSILPSPSICLDAYRRRESVEACRSGTSPQTLREDNKSSWWFQRAHITTGCEASHNMEHSTCCGKILPPRPTAARRTCGEQERRQAISFCRCHRKLPTAPATDLPSLPSPQRSNAEQSGRALLPQPARFPRK